MDTIEAVEECLSASVRGLIDTLVMVAFPGEAELDEAAFLGIERDERGDWYIAVRRLGVPIVEGVHPSRVKL